MKDSKIPAKKALSAITPVVINTLVLTLLLLVMSGCGGSEPFSVRTDIVPYTQEEALAREAAANARYRLRGGDVVSVTFKYEPELDQDNVVILPDGYVSVVGLDSGVKAAGLTIEELDESLTGSFGGDIKNPSLTIIVQEISEPEIYVMGMVKSPGMYKLPWNGVGVLQAISSAGGFHADANKSETAILRSTDEGFFIRVVDLSNVERLGINDLAFLDIQPFDIVYVPRSSLGTFAYVTSSIFGNLVDVSRFFLDISAIARLNEANGIIR
jgi:protein involved in polysaccharide export with SLBB domain